MIKQTKEKKVKLGFEELSNEKFLKISNYDTMRPFFMSILSDSDHWMFISSNGGLTAGRKNAEYALFPYYTDDKITELAEITGSKTIIRVLQENEVLVWEPFSIRNQPNLAIERNIYKSIINNKLVFEEKLLDFNLVIRYCWANSSRFGFVKTTTLINNSEQKLTIEVLDGIQNLLPYGVGSDLQRDSSNLVDAYKRSELEPTTGLGIFALSAIIVDKAEPSEALKANVAWSVGAVNPTYLLSSLQLDKFRKGLGIDQESDIKGEKGAYFVNQAVVIEANNTHSWKIIADVNKNHSQLIELISDLKTAQNIADQIDEDIRKGTQNLEKLVNLADGLQLTNDKLQDCRSYSNVLFNIMRGGIFDNNYEVQKSDFVRYIQKANKKLFLQYEEVLSSLPTTISYTELQMHLLQSNQPDLIRLVVEYLPLKFSRRHGDPSRPWNKFSINIKDEAGGTVLDYQGNWRDIFQNWEALAYAYPYFIDGMLHKFVNASTFDGYNPYRVTKDGFDWETIEPDDPWSYIGYWGDHQIIYLLKFLEFIDKFSPNKLQSYFDKDWFVYAAVPYIIKPYEDIVKNPKDTIIFDRKWNEKVRKNITTHGSDGALLQTTNGAIYHINLIEKLMATLLAKLSNFIPQGGIWLNTQRPEWNDANNALVGNGVSMVTLCYIRRFLVFFDHALQNTSASEFLVSSELHQLFDSIHSIFDENRALLHTTIADSDRKTMVDYLGKAASEYRTHIYEAGFEGKKVGVSAHKLRQFIDISLAFINHSIEHNQRPDGLYHSYNIMNYTDTGVTISYLDEMLEGQVAVLSSGYLNEAQALEVLDAMKKSALFRPDQYSYILYPNKNLAGFLSKNIIPERYASASKLIQQWVNEQNTAIVEKDLVGQYHFNGNFKNANDLKIALKKQASDINESEEKLLIEAFEAVFNHKTFTGRSGTFFGYEGLGSIYWHMVSKLLLAVQECIVKAVEKKGDRAIINRLIDHYFEIKAGIGVHKSPELYGAFPTDPYSHTPQHRGAQQPGMTGQVKEDVISRLTELGVSIKDGKLCFEPVLLRKAEFLTQAAEAKYYSKHAEPSFLALEPNQLFFTYCHVPIIYELGNSAGIRIETIEPKTIYFEGNTLDDNWSKTVFERNGKIKSMTVTLRDSQLLA